MDLREYGVATHLYKPIIKRAVVDFAVGADWTPVAGDVTISKDGGAAANVTNLPVAIVMGNTAMWDYSLTAAELQGKQIKVMVADAAAKVVEDQFLEIETYGNPAAQHAANLNDTVRLGLTALPNVVSGNDGSLMVRGATQDITLKSLSIVNSAGDALVLTASGGNGSGLNASGNGTGHGIKCTGGATGNGVNAIGGATSGSAVKATGTAGNAIALELVGQGSAAGLSATGGATGNGALLTGGATSGAGVRAVGAAGNANGLEGVGQGSGNGMAVTGGATGHGLQCTGGATSGQGLQAAAGGSGDGIRTTGTTNGHGFQALGAGTGRGLICTGGLTGPGLQAIGGATSGPAARFTSTSGDGLEITPTAGNAITATANGTAKHGIVATGAALGVSDGIKGVAGAAGGVDIRGNITGNVTGSVTSVVNRVTANTDQIEGVDATDQIFAAADLAAVGALTTDTYAEPAAVPAATASLKDKIGFIYSLLRNKRTTTATTDTLRNDADAGTIGASTVSDDGVTFTKGKYT